MLGPQQNPNNAQAMDPSVDFDPSLDDPLTFSMSMGAFGGSFPASLMGDDMPEEEVDTSKMSATERRKYNQKKRQKRKKSTPALTLDDDDAPKQPSKKVLDMTHINNLDENSCDRTTTTR
jgi:hypothetical protein